MVTQLWTRDLSQIRSARVRRLHEYWRAKGAQRDGLPLRRDVDPAELRDLLPFMMIVDVERDPMRFRYRLVGTRVVEFNHREFTGLYLGTIGWQDEQVLLDAYVEVTTNRRARFGYYTWELRSGGLGNCEFVLLPLSGESGRIDQIVALEDYDFPLIDIDPTRI